MREYTRKAVYALFAKDIFSKTSEPEEFAYSAAPAPHAPSPAAYNGKPSVCLVEGWLGPGGAERQLAMLAVALHERGHHVRVRVQSLEGKGGYLAPHLRSQGIDVADLKPAYAKAVITLAQYGIPATLLNYIPLSQRPSALMLAAELLRSPVDVVHSYYDHPNIFGSWAGLLSGTPVIRCSWRSGKPVGMFYFEPWMQEQYRLLGRCPTVSFESNSAFSARDYAKWIGIAPERVLISPNGFNQNWDKDASQTDRTCIRTELGISAENPVVIFVGRLSPEKRPFDLLDIFQILTKLRADVHCIIAGSDFLDREVADALERFPSDNRRRVHLLGIREDVPALLKASDVFLLTSEVESFSNALLEALSIGLPVVVTNTGGTPEIVKNGLSGYLVQLGDTKRMSQLINALFDNPELRRKMGDNGKSVAQNFTAEALYKRAMASYTKELGQTNRYGPRLRPSLFNIFSALCRNCQR